MTKAGNILDLYYVFTKLCISKLSLNLVKSLLSINFLNQRSYSHLILLLFHILLPPLKEIVLFAHGTIFQMQNCRLKTKRLLL